MRMAPPSSASFQSVFEDLRDLLTPFESALQVDVDTTEDYSLYTPHSEAYDRELFFGAAQIKKNYVSYHLMPVYMYPDLLDDLSPTLRKRMQGKSCFNFTKIGAEERAELRTLTQKGFDRLIAEGVLNPAT